MMSLIVSPSKGAGPEHLEEHDAERPDVGALVDRRPRACSGDMYAAVPRITPACVIAGRTSATFDRTRRLAESGVHGLRQAEVEHLDRAVGAQLDVGRLQIAMDDPLRRARPRALPRSARAMGSAFVDGERPAG